MVLSLFAVTAFFESMRLSAVAAEATTNALIIRPKNMHTVVKKISASVTGSTSSADS